MTVSNNPSFEVPASSLNQEPNIRGETHQKVISVALTLGGIALFAIFISAISGAVSGRTAGLVGLGLTGGSILLSGISVLTNKNLTRNQKITNFVGAILAQLFVIVLSSLAATSVISGHTFGWIPVGSLIAGVGLGVLLSPCIGYGIYRYLKNTAGKEEGNSIESLLDQIPKAAPPAWLP